MLYMFFTVWWNFNKTKKKKKKKWETRIADFCKILYNKYFFTLIKLIVVFLPAYKCSKDKER